MTPKSRSTSSLSSTADGSSMMINFASCERARAMLTVCWEAAESEPTSAPGRISGCPRRVSSCEAARLETAGRVIPICACSRPRKMLSATERPETRSSSW